MKSFSRSSSFQKLVPLGLMRSWLVLGGLSACASPGEPVHSSDSPTDKVLSCVEPQVDCDGTCAVLRTDGDHCGTCAVSCAGADVCSRGICQEMCGTGLTQCGNSCLHLERSAEHCGECDNICASGVCDDGVCQAAIIDNPGGGGSGATSSGGSSSGGNDGGGSGGMSTASGGENSTGGPREHAKFVGNITTGDQVDTTGKKFSDHWDQITPENAGKWGSVEWNAGAGYSWGTLDAIYDYAEDNNILFKQHAFVWGEQQPGGNISENDVKNWMKAFCERYPKTSMIDVVNEPPPHTSPSYVNSIGGGTDGDWKWITNSFNWARESCPNAILILNDYNNIEWQGDSDHFIDIVNTVLAAGGPIDAVGAQSHDLDHPDISTAKMKDLLANLHDKTGLPVYITEYDISTGDDAQQLKTYQEQISHFLEMEYVHGITIWGWVRGRTWSKAPDSGLISGSGSPRPAMTWLMETLGRPVP